MKMKLVLVENVTLLSAWISPFSSRNETSSSTVLFQTEGNTIVFIAHDMREIAEADYLVVMHHGRLEACLSFCAIQNIIPDRT